MYPGEPGLVEWVVIGVVIIWLSGLSLLFRKNRQFLNQLFPAHRQAKMGFQEKLEELLEEVKGLEEFKKASQSNLQKVVLKRYNPYHDTGGNQSFSLVLLDGKDNGIVITSLHSRVGTRVFAKPVIDGKQVDFEFAKEEIAAINEAMKQ